MSDEVKAKHMLFSEEALICLQIVERWIEEQTNGLEFAQSKAWEFIARDAASKITALEALRRTMLSDLIKHRRNIDP